MPHLRWQISFPFVHSFGNIELLSQTPFILMGDFNCPASIRNEGYDLIMTSNVNLIDTYAEAKIVEGDCTIEKSIDGWGVNTQNLRIDYIFTSNNFSVETYNAVFDGIETPRISDHLGIEVEIEFKFPQF